MADSFDISKVNCMFGSKEFRSENIERLVLVRNTARAPAAIYAASIVAQRQLFYSEPLRLNSRRYGLGT
eukprot:SAG31_NODE_12447_length_941_cov_2.290974_2_plen_69_part_00